MFAYSAEVLERFPQVRGGVALLGGVDGGPSPAGLAQAYRAEQAAVRAQLGDQSLAALPSLAAWRRTFSAFGVEPTKYRNAAEALLRRLTKKGDVPSVSALVDLGNLVSIRHAVPVAVFDTARVAGGLTVRFATGDERFADLGGTEADRPLPGEVIFVDESGAVGARRWCWRQSTTSAAGPTTVEALVTVEAVHEDAEAAVTAALDSLRQLVADHLPAATVATAVLGPDRPAFGERGGGS
jgi:DNA/RNA-binding domain of Phe-tRNA-synthetase-like protein